MKKNIIIAIFIVIIILIFFYLKVIRPIRIEDEKTRLYSLSLDEAIEYCKSYKGTDKDCPKTICHLENLDMGLGDPRNTHCVPDYCGIYDYPKPMYCSDERIPEPFRETSTY